MKALQINVDDDWASFDKIIEAYSRNLKDIPSSRINVVR